jgi:hypothetical protein
VEAATAQAAEQEAQEAAVEPVIEELSADDIPTLEVAADEITVDETPTAVEEATAEEISVEEPAVEEAEIVVPEIVVPEPIVSKAAVPKVVAPKPVPPKTVAPKTVAPKIVAREIVAPEFEAPEFEASEPAAVEEIPVVAEASVAAEPEPVSQEQAQEQAQVHEAEPETAPGVLKEFVSDLETSLGDSFLPGTVIKKPVTAPASQPAATAPAAHTEPVVSAGPTAPVLGEFVADIEASLGEDFLKAAPVAGTEPHAPVAKAKPVPPMPAPVAAPKVVPPLAASAAASASTNHIAPAPQGTQAQTPAPIKPAPVATASVAWQAPVEAPKPPAIPATHAPAASAPATVAKASPFGEDAGVDIAEMFGELKHDLEADVASADEDPETHYNLGIAFREMGLLDEAIGELQKACQSFDHGHPFPQIMQTYTWLAQCFLDKGVPEAAVRWYEKALNVATIDGETRVALHYELAAAYETAGDKPSALRHFMEVYGSNIDYRDVAERIKALKS